MNRKEPLFRVVKRESSSPVRQALAYVAAVVIALLIGGTLFGVAGMILTVPVTAVLQILCKHLWFYNTYKEKAMKYNGNNENRNQ